MSLDSKIPPNRVKIQSRMGLDSKIPSEQGQNSIKERSIVPFVRTNLHSTILSHFSETVDPPRAPTSIPQRGDGCPSRKQYICNCRNRYNSSDKLCKWYTHCAVMVWVTLLYIKAVR